MRSITLVYYLLINTFFPSFSQTNLKNNQFYLRGKIIGQNNGIVSLTYFSKKGKKIVDSVTLKKGEFNFTGFISEPTLANLRGNVNSIADDDPNAGSFYIEPGKAITALVEINRFKKIKITGSRTQKEYEALQRKYEIVDNTSDSASENYSKINYEFVTAHPDSYLSPFLLELYKTRWSLDSVRLIYHQLSHQTQESFYGIKIAKFIDDVDDNDVGKIAELFGANDIKGDEISLSEFKDKYILIDFWASWCVPCRQGATHLLELYRKYHEKGLEIIAVSDDDDIEAWKMAVRKDNIGIWYNILSSADTSEEVGQSSSISKKYGVHVLPTKFLVDRHGIIIGRYTGTEEDPTLDQKLSEVFE